VRRLTVLFDEACPACARFGAWVAREPAYVPLELVGLRSEGARRRFPTLAAAKDAHVDVVAVGDGGEVWRGPRAWTLALWALRGHRERALRPGSAEQARHEHDAALATPVHPPAVPPTVRAAVPQVAVASRSGSGCVTLFLVLLAVVVVGLAIAPEAEPAVLGVVALLVLVGVCGLVQGLLALLAWFLFDALGVGNRVG
jgi:hypothetical protein